MNLTTIEYVPILMLFIVSTALSFIIFGLSYVVASQRPDSEKVSAYECGFEPFEDTRSKFDIKFYLVAILFIIFDLEISYLFPWSVVLKDINLFGFWSMIFFLIILTVGFIFEWLKGALDWN